MELISISNKIIFPQSPRCGQPFSFCLLAGCIGVIDKSVLFHFVFSFFTMVSFVCYYHKDSVICVEFSHSMFQERLVDLLC